MSIGEYFLSVISASVIAALITMLCGDEKSTLGKALSTACSLFLLCVILSPVASIVARVREESDVGDWDPGGYESLVSVDDALYASLAALSEAQIEEVLHSHVSQSAGIDPKNIEVRAETIVADGKVLLERVILCLYSEARWCDPRVLSEAVSMLTDAECLIINGEGNEE